MKEKISVASVVLSVFKAQKKATLKDLYAALESLPETDKIVKPNNMHHRVRSCVYSMTKSNKIIRVGDATYALIE